MKFNFILNNLITTVCVLVSSKAYHISQQASQQLQQHYKNYQYYHHQLQHEHDDDDDDNEQSQENLVANELTGYDHYHHDHRYQFAEQQNYFNDLHIKQLAELAKNPENLRNGIYHDGAITYDLGLPNYKILNPYDPPEIITSDHPHYHEQLNRIKKTNNFTIEDFGVTPMPDSDTISETTSTESVTTITSATDIDNYVMFTTTTDMADTMARETTIATTTTAVPETTAYPMQKNKRQKYENDVSKFLNKTKEKLKILNNELDLKNKNQTNSFNHANNISSSYPKDHQQLTTKEIMQQSLSIIPVQTFAKDSKFAKSLYGESVVLPVDQISSALDLH